MTDKQAKSIAIRSARNGYVRLAAKRGCEAMEVAITLMSDETSVWFSPPSAAKHSDTNAATLRFTHTDDILNMIELLAGKGYRLIQ